MFSSPDDVHDLMDDIVEQQEVADEITTALSTGIGHAEDVDEVCVNFLYVLAVLMGGQNRS